MIVNNQHLMPCFHYDSVVWWEDLRSAECSHYMTDQRLEWSHYAALHQYAKEIKILF